jgi:glycerophosphoryl diester phosphodiesterase
MFKKLPKPAIFAHRGASFYAPENTLPAFELALEQNSDGIELDAKLSADDQVVIIHDQTLDRTTNGVGKVGDFSLKDLKELDAGVKFSPIYKGTPIPTLAEALGAIGRKCLTNIELSNYTSPFDRLPEKVAGILTEHSLEDHVIISSFNPLALIKFHRFLPVVPLGLLAMPGFPGWWARSVLGRWIPHQALHPEVRDTHESLIRKCHRHGIRVHPYTINSKRIMAQLFLFGVDGIFTDDPPLAQKVLKASINTIIK